MGAIERKKEIWKFGGFRIEHYRGGDSYLVYLDNKWTTVYRTLVGAKKWVSKKTKIGYSKIEWKYSEQTIQ
jgi:hypothetical protein